MTRPGQVARLLALVPTPDAIEVMTHALGQRDPARPAARSRPDLRCPAARRAAPAPIRSSLAEREYLSQSRQFLRLMREDVLSLRALGGDPVSEEYLKADLYRRAEALSDLPDTPAVLRPARLAPARAATAASSRASGSTSAGGTCTTRRASRSWSTGGRRCPGPSTGPARPSRWGWSCAAGSASPAASSPRTRTRCSPAARARLGRPAVSRILIQEIERPRSGPMRDIVATIPPDQDDIVRAGPDHTLCVQGAPGTGKTAVGLHRIAYLLYAYPGRMTRGGVLVIGPNRAFLSYIRNVLPALGEVNVTQTTLADLLARVPVRAPDPPGPRRSRATPGWPRCCAGRSGPGCASPPRRSLVVRGSRRWRVGPGELAGLVGGTARPRGPLRRRPGDAGPPDRARHPDPDGGRRGDLRRPDPRGGAADPAGARRGGRHLAQGRPGAAGAAAAVRPGRCWPGPPGGCWTRPSSRPSAGTRRRAGRPRPAGARRTRSWSTRPVT